MSELVGLGWRTPVTLLQPNAAMQPCGPQVNRSLDFSREVPNRELYVKSPDFSINFLKLNTKWAVLHEPNFVTSKPHPTDKETESQRGEAVK